MTSPANLNPSAQTAAAPGELEPLANFIARIGLNLQLPDAPRWIGRALQSRQPEAILVHYTRFFRDLPAWEYLARIARELLSRQPRNVRVLCLGCSTGEEAYSISITLLSAGLAPEAFEITALDASREALRVAREGVYPSHQLSETPQAFHGYFEFLPVTTATKRVGAFRGQSIFKSVASSTVKVCPVAASPVRFVQGNAIEPGAFDGPFDVIFCRNVIVYLQANARERLASHIRNALAPGGLLFVSFADAPLFAEHGFTGNGSGAAYALHPTPFHLASGPAN